MWDDCPEMALDPVEPEIVGFCLLCGKEIYRGETYFHYYGWPHCEDCGEALKDVLTLERIEPL